MIEAEKDNKVNANLINGYFLYNKVKTRGSTLYVTKTKFSKESILSKNTKLQNDIQNLLD